MTRFLGKVPMAIAAVAIVVVAAQIAAAQDAGGGQGRGGRGGGGGGFGGQGGGRGRGGGGATFARFAANADVQALVKATDDQKAKITALNEKLTTDRAAAVEAAAGDFQAIGAANTKLANEAGTKMAEALDATQTENVLSVLVQAGGGPALTDAVLAKRLKLTAEQTTKLAAVQPPRGGGGRGASEEEQAAARAERDKLYTDILTADQKTEWAKLEKAQKVDDELLGTLRRGGGGGRGRGRGGRGGGGM